MVKLATPSIAQREAIAAYKLWRVSVAAALEAASMPRDAENFRSCQRHYDVDVCVVNVDHAPRAVPYTCHLRFCPDCERREQARKLARFVPVIHDILMLGKAGYTLKHIVLTSPYMLGDDDMQNRYKNAWRALERLLDRVFYSVLDADGCLSPSEKRRGRADMKKHGIGVLAAAEFGEQGHKLHFHLMAYCPFIPKKRLSAIWSACTQGDAEVSYIEKIDLDEVEKAVIEVAKYVTKFGDLPPSLVPALANAINGSRRIRTYGIMHAIGKTERGACSCPICSADRQLVGIMSYIRMCEFAGVAPESAVVETVENASLYS